MIMSGFARPSQPLPARLNGRPPGPLSIEEAR